MIDICKAPLIRVENLNEWKKAKDGHMYHPARVFGSKQLEKFDNLLGKASLKELQEGWGNWQLIPCGKCIECRLENSRQWATRGYLESIYYKNNYFVTLTYDDQHLPKVEEMTTEEGITYTEQPGIIDWHGCLNPKDLELFVKNLRKIMADKKIQAEGIRVMECGEYGNQNKENPKLGYRPHYHLILLNCNLPLDTFYNPRVDWQKAIHWQNKIIEAAWSEPGTKGHPGKQKGICEICEANWNTIAYVARYVTKKIYGDESEDHYAMRGQKKEFFRVSNRPGIGRQYYEDHKEEIYKNDRVMIRNRNGTVWVNPPKYYDDLYEQEDPEHMEYIKKKRRKHMMDNLKIRGSTTSLDRWNQYQVELREIEARTKQLLRPM